jgi:hypothetical protein
VLVERDALRAPDVLQVEPDVALAGARHVTLRAEELRAAETQGAQEQRPAGPGAVAAAPGAVAAAPDALPARDVAEPASRVVRAQRGEPAEYAVRSSVPVRVESASAAPDERRLAPADAPVAEPEPRAAVVLAARALPVADRIVVPARRAPRRVVFPAAPAPLIALVSIPERPVFLAQAPAGSAQDDFL